MATADFAVGFLEDLVREGYNVACVVTTPDKPAGRGRKLTPSPIKTKAQELGLSILQPERLSESSFIEQLNEIHPYIGIVIAFRMLPESVWDLPELGTYNIHGSLLPRWRGAAPINHALIAGDKKTGVTLFKLRQELDAGDIVGIEEVSINSDDTFGELHDKLALIGRRLLMGKLPDLLDRNTTTTQQILQTEEPYASKLTRENTQIDWNQPAEVIHNFVRGLSPHPTAWSTLISNKSDKKIYKILKSVPSTNKVPPTVRPGRIFIDGKKQMSIACKDGELLQILKIQAPGKKPLEIKDFLNGTVFSDEEYFL